MKYFLYLFVLCMAVWRPSLVHAADVQTVNKAPVAVQAEGASVTPAKVTPAKVTPAKAKLAKVTPVKAKSAKSVAKSGAVEDMGLMLQNILLYQGEGGSELWRLKASYASMSTDDDVTSVEAPVVRYTLGDPELKDYVHVTALKGKITENQRFLVLSGDVQVWRADQRITGPMMRYDAKTRTMTFLQGARLRTSAGEGSTKVLSWQLDDNILRAKGAVKVLLK